MMTHVSEISRNLIQNNKCNGLQYLLYMLTNFYTTVRSINFIFVFTVSTLFDQAMIEQPDSFCLAILNSCPQ